MNIIDRLNRYRRNNAVVIDHDTIKIKIELTERKK